MSDDHPFPGSTALAIAAAALGLVACGSEAGTQPSTNNGSVAGAPSFAGAPAVSGAGGASVNAPGAGGVVSTPAPGAGGSVGSAGTPATLPGTGGASAAGAPGAGGAVASGGASASGGDPGAGGATPGGPSTIGGPADDWKPTDHLDANGLLIAPAAGQGVQITTTNFDLNPGDEVFRCFHTNVGNAEELDVGHWESQMSAGSHHFILYTADTDTTPANTLSPSGCAAGGFGGSTWLYTAGSPRWHLPYPDGVAVPLQANQKIVFDMHYINTGTTSIHAHVTLNVEKVKSAEFQKAQALISFNSQIAIPPNGTQTVGGDCTPPSGVNFFLMGTHTHRRGIDASITRKLANGQMGQQLVHTTNWDAPQAVLWLNAPYLTFDAGEKFHYSCSYQNDRSQTTTVGQSAANNEMCMAITYFFPAKSGGSCN
jgi:hypothetical protein